MFKLNSRMAKVGIALLLVALMIFIPLSVAFAGQPGVECEDVRPGHASTAPGSAFNEDGQVKARWMTKGWQLMCSMLSVI